MTNPLPLALRPCRGERLVASANDERVDAVIDAVQAFRVRVAYA